MATVNITTKSGTRITIQGSAGEVARIVAEIDQPSHGATKKAARENPTPAAKGRKTTPSIGEMLIGLKQDKFFDKPKSLSQIAAELEKSGYMYPTTTLSGVVLSLLKKKHLTRAKKDGQWAYGKR